MQNNIDVNVIVNGADELKNLSVSLRRMILAISDSANATKVLDARQRALNAALGATGRGFGDHAKTLRQAASNQAVLSEEIKKTTQELKNLKKIAASGAGGVGMPNLIDDLDKTSKSLKKIKARTLISDLRGVGQEMKRMGKDAQFVGRSLIIGLTTPIVAFGRVGLQNFYAIDKALVRLEKLLSRNRDEMQGLTKAATEFSYEFGIAKELILGVTGDFAELGINSDEVLKKLTELTGEFTILGDMDVSSARELTQTLYLGSLRSMEMTGEIRKFNSAAEAQEAAVKRVNAQMYLFNAVENATALSMREIAQALPEVSAAGQIFGLNFTEMMALLAPMKAIGIDVGAASTGIKVSFQKLVNPTIKLQKELKQLSAEAKKVGDTKLAEDFLGIQGIGMDAIQSLVDVTTALKKSAGGSEAVLSFYSKLFDDRQATRMLIAMEDLGNFQAGFFASSTGAAVTAQERFVSAINKSLSGTGLLVNDIESLSQVTMMANAALEEGAQSIYIEALGREVTRAEISAAKQARRDLQEFIKTESEAGRNAIEDITSEAGKALAISFAGASNAMQLAEDELQRAKDSTAMSIDRIKIAFKNLTATFIEDLAPTIRDIADRFQQFVKRIQEMDPNTRKLIAGVVAAVAAIGPLVFIFGQARLAGGVLLESIMKLVPGLKSLSLATVAGNSKLLHLRNGLTMTGNTIVNTNSRFATFIATLASGNGPIAKIANRFGELTGMLKSTTTATKDVERAITSVSGAGSATLKSATAEMFNPAMMSGARSGQLTDPKVYKETLEMFTAQEMGRLGFAGAASQKVDIQRIIDAGNKTVAESTKGIADQNALVSKIQRGMAKKGYQQSADDIAKWTITANNRVLDEHGKFVQKQTADDFKRLVNYHQARTGLALNTEKNIIAQQQAMARAAAQQQMADQVRNAQQRNANIAAAEMQARNIAKQRIRDEIADAKAMQAKMPFYAKKKIDVSDTGEFSRKGRVISQASADRIAGGGVGSVVERTKLGIKQLGELGKKPVLKIRDMATAPINNFRKHVALSKAAVNQLIARNAAFGKTAPGAFARARVAALAFGKSVLNASKMFKILKMTMLASGVGAIILGFAAAVLFVVKNFDKIRTQAKPGLDALKNAFEALKNIGKALVKPFLDFFAMLGGGGGEKGKSTIDGIANAFNKVSFFIQKAAEFVESFVNKYVVPLLYKALGAIFNIIKGIVKFIQGIIKLKDNWREGLKMMFDGLMKIGRAIIGLFLSGVLRPMIIGVFQVARLIVMAFTNMGKGVVNIFREMAKININIIFGLAEAGVKVVQFIIDAFALLPRGIGNGIEAAANLFADFVDGIANAVRGTPIIGWLADKAGLVDAARSGADAIRGAGKWIGDLGRSTADGVSSISDDLAGLVTAGRDAVLGLVDGAADGINNFLDSIPDAIEDAGDWVAGLLEGFGQGGDIGRGAGDALVEGTKEEVEENLEDAITDPFIDAGGDAGAAGGEAAGKEMLAKIAEIIKDLKQKFVDLVLDSVKGALDEATEQLEEALNKQKEAALAVYDTQLKTIEKLEKAEESLTREKEYQANRRRIIDERELQRANYQRNRALAIYEGRIDDARVLGLEDQKNQIDFQEKIAKTDEDRRKDLIKENLDYLKESIKNAQEETAKMLDEQIEAFQKAAKEITKFPPLTIEEYTTQLGQLNEAAQSIAGENGEILKDMMAKMKDNLKMPNATVGVFATGLDELVKVAQQKYGLTATSADNTIVGSTIGMLAGIEGQIVGNRDDIVSAFNGIVTDVFNVAASFGNIADQIISPALDEMSRIFEEKNPMKVFEQAIKDANETILREMQRTVGHVASLVDGLANEIEKALIELAIAQEKLTGGLGGGPTGGGATDGSTPGSPNGPSVPSNPPAPNLPNREALISQAVSQAFSSGIGNMLSIDQKNYLKQFTIGSLTRSYSEAGFGMAHYNTLKKNATTPIGRISLQLWEFASKRLGLPVSGSATPAANPYANYITRGQFRFPPGITQKFDTITKKNRWYDSTKNQYLPDPPTGPLPSNKVYRWSKVIGDPGYGKWTAVSRMFGGRVPKMLMGGAVPGYGSQSIPALLHGGEYVVNAKAVRNIGYAALEAMNNMKYASPGKVSAPTATTINETQNINIYVDTFVGEDQWFESMMKEYNLKVVPRNQKTAGVQSRTISSYNGLNRGM